MGNKENKTEQAPIRDWGEFGSALRDYTRWLPRGVMASDVDMLVHASTSSGDRFLVLEFKQAGQPLPMGQKIMLGALAKRPEFTVVVAWGPDEQGLYVLGHAWRGKVDETGLATLVENWWESAKSG